MSIVCLMSIQFFSRTGPTGPGREFQSNWQKKCNKKPPGYYFESNYTIQYLYVCSRINGTDSSPQSLDAYSRACAFIHSRGSGRAKSCEICSRSLIRQVPPSSRLWLLIARPQQAAHQPQNLSPSLPLRVPLGYQPLCY